MQITSFMEMYIIELQELADLEAQLADDLLVMIQAASTSIREEERVATGLRVLRLPDRRAPSDALQARPSDSLDPGLLSREERLSHGRMMARASTLSRTSGRGGANSEPSSSSSTSRSTTLTVPMAAAPTTSGGLGVLLGAGGEFTFPQLMIGGCRYGRGVIHADDTCDEFKPRRRRAGSAPS